MERDFYTDEFEELIKLKADQYRMYPSEKVWKGIKRSLHSNKRKYWFGFALLLTGLSYFGIDQLIVSPPAKQIIKPAAGIASEDKQQAKIVPFEQIIPGSLDETGSKAIAPEKVEHSPVSNPIVQGQVAQENQGTQDPTAGFDALLVVAETPSNLESGGLLLETSPPRQFPIIGLDRPQHTILISPITADQSKTQAVEEDIQKINWLQEYAVYELSPVKPQRINWQLSFAPTMNYRRLIGRNNANMQSSSRNIPIALNIEGDLDKLVNHKPALGFELGSYLVYGVNHNLALKGGLQFNYSRYEIQAYSSATERATISLNSINGIGTSSISNLTQLRNFGGYAVQDLQNQYFQLSIPLGIEVNLLGSSKLQLGVAGTVQPTYLLNRTTYLISSDYKNYTKEPSLVRRWNVNTSAETFVSYKTAGLKWQVGPQIRYQLFSSYTDKYPIKEYLIEYGVKIGVTKTIR